MAGIRHSGKLPKLWECIGRLDETSQAAYVKPAALGRVFPDLALFGISQFRSTRLQRYTTWNSHENPAEGGRLHVHWACTLKLARAMSSHPLSTISEMMEQYAADAVRLAPQFGVALDYSESSLEALEHILDQLAGKRPISEAEPRSEDTMQKELDSVSRIWGGYFGETIRRLWGGEWGVETYPGTIAPVISVDIGGAKLFPVMKIYRRLTKGQDENVWRFYQMVRERVSKGRKQ